jgi:hypothetical protein
LSLEKRIGILSSHFDRLLIVIISSKEQAVRRRRVSRGSSDVHLMSGEGLVKVREGGKKGGHLFHMSHIQESIAIITTLDSLELALSPHLERDGKSAIGGGGWASIAEHDVTEPFWNRSGSSESFFREKEAWWVALTSLDLETSEDQRWL